MPLFNYAPGPSLIEMPFTDEVVRHGDLFAHSSTYLRLFPISRKATKKKIPHAVAEVPVPILVMTTDLAREATCSCRHAGQAIAAIRECKYRPRREPRNRRRAFPAVEKETCGGAAEILRLWTAGKAYMRPGADHTIQLFANCRWPKA